MLRFLHAGDLHLGSAAAAFSPRVAARRRERQLAALERLIADALAAGGLKVARRTVAKYREELNIPDANHRKVRG